MKTVLFSGRAGVGKTTTANYLKDLIFGYDKYASCGVVSFASRVKQIAKEFGWDGLKDDKGRKLLQEIGKIGREYNPYIYAEHLYKSEMLLNINQEAVFLVDDWRFPNEYDYLRLDSLLEIYRIKIIAPELELLKGTCLYNDESETALLEYSLENYDAIFYNEIGLENVRAFTDALYKMIFIDKKGGQLIWNSKINF